MAAPAGRGPVLEVSDGGGGRGGGRRLVGGPGPAGGTQAYRGAPWVGGDLPVVGVLGMLVGQGIVRLTGWRLNTGYSFLDDAGMAVIGAILVILLARFIA